MNSYFQMITIVNPVGVLFIAYLKTLADTGKDHFFIMDFKQVLDAKINKLKWPAEHLV